MEKQRTDRHSIWGVINFKSITDIVNTDRTFLTLQLIPVVSCLVIKDSTPAIAGGRGNLRAIQIKHDWKSAQNKKGKKKKECRKWFTVYYLTLPVFIEVIHFIGSDTILESLSIKV